MSVQNKINGFTSDHTWQSAAVQLISPKDKASVIEIKGATWNLLNKCFSKKNNPRGRHYANNPWDLDETNEEYADRIKAQEKEFDEMFAANVDFVFLQEIDFISYRKHEPYKSIYTSFKNYLDANGYDVIFSKKSKDKIGQQPLAIVYKKDTLKPISKGKSIFPSSGRYRAWEVEFEHIPSGQQVDLVPFHLDYNKDDYPAEIDTFQKDKIQNNRFTIMGGDANHAQNQEMEGLVGNWHYATNIGMDRKITVTKNGKTFTKRYDGFLVNPTKETYAKITGTEGKYFDGEIGNYQALPMPDDRDYKIYNTDVGKAWKAGIYYLRDLHIKLGQEKSKKKKQKIFEHMFLIFKHRVNSNLGFFAFCQQNKFDHLLDEFSLNDITELYNKFNFSTDASNESTLILSETTSESSNSESGSYEDEDSSSDNIENSFEDILNLSNKKILEFMHWSAYPRIREKVIDSAKDALKEYDFGRLADDDDIKRALFNLALYAEKLSAGTKRTALKQFLTDVSKLDDDDNPDQLISDALQNDQLIRNTRSGAYRWFHSLPKRIKNQHRDGFFKQARSTTEELLLDLEKSAAP